MSTNSGLITHNEGTAVVTVVLIDDHPVVRTGSAAVLSALDHVRVVGQAGSAEEGVRLVEQHLPNVVYCDVRLPGMDGIEACELIRQRFPRVKVILLTQFSNESVLMRGFAAGANGFVVKDSDPDALCRALEIVMAGNKFIDPKVASRMVHIAAKGRRATGPYGLTIAEMRVVELLPKGNSNAEIALELGVKIDTVKTHVKAILRKLGVSDRAQAAAVAIREGLA